ncbi:uncharacterized protein LOC121429665 isoform X2 [Lytechinus variegatus]|uniref:uncharacterized protein LOC121429665 isoform X2 n=1 Tax=Lytechinus variegatus TaxID=7654 RepID=UPI001BB1778E|nr:uncharacterized protein LOC121429665 isoform X2 [Lytechinus variegatus]
MEAFSTNKSRLSFNEKHGGRLCSETPSLAHVLTVVTALVFIATPVIYSLSVLRAQAALVAELRAEMTELQERVRRLEAVAPMQKPDQDEAKNLERILANFGEDQGEGDADENQERYKDNDFLDKLFGKFELGSEPDNTQWEEDRNNAWYHDPEEKMLTEVDSLKMSQEAEDPSTDSYRTSLRRHGDQLFTNHRAERDDVTWESIKGRGHRRPRRQAENRESRRNRNRDEKRASRRNRGNRGSTGKRDRGNEETRRQNGGGESPPQYESAYIHFVGNVSSRVRTQNLLSDWAYAYWTPRRQKENFVLNNGVVTVKEPGVYFIYSQVQFFDDHRLNGHVITIQGIEEERFKCAERPAQNPLSMQTCYVGGLAFLHRDSRVAVRLAFSHRWVNMHRDSTYFGMYKVADLSKQD